MSSPSDKVTPSGQASQPAPSVTGPRSDRESDASIPATLSSHTTNGATAWLTESPAALSVWRGDVDAPDRLRVETRDGRVEELRLTPRGILKLGRSAQVGAEVNELVYPDVASRLAAVLRHDGSRWWIRRREECSVPVQVGARSLGRNEEAAMVHGTLVVVGGMRAIFTDRRYLTPSVPAETVDAQTGLLARIGLEQEVSVALRRKKGATLLLFFSPVSSATSAPDAKAYSPTGALAIELSRALPDRPVAHVGDAAVLLIEEASALPSASSAIASIAPSPPWFCGRFSLQGESADAGREVEIALGAVERLRAALASSGTLPPGTITAAGGAIDLRQGDLSLDLAEPHEIVSSAQSDKRITLLFAIESQAGLDVVGNHIVGALEQELAAVVKSHAGPTSVVGSMARGVVAASLLRGKLGKEGATTLGSAVQCDWHARPPILDGRSELPRSLSWEISQGAEVSLRAKELARECSDPNGVLSSLGGGLPYPIAGRVAAAVSARSGVERVKMLFDVLEGTWRFIAVVLASAYFVKRVEGGARPKGLDAFLDLARRFATRDGLALGTWRELARHAAKGLDGDGDPISLMAREVLGVRLSENQTVEALSNLLQAERNAFAHGHYTEARAETDLPEFEQMTRTLLRALRPLSNWTLVTVEGTEPDMYGDGQTVEFIDHTGPWAHGTRRKIILNSPLRLANVTYLARWREGLVLPLEPFVRRIASEDRDRFELYWMDHLPRATPCTMSHVLGGHTTRNTLDVRRLPPLLRLMIEQA